MLLPLGGLTLAAKTEIPANTCQSQFGTGITVSDFDNYCVATLTLLLNLDSLCIIIVSSRHSLTCGSDAEKRSHKSINIEGEVRCVNCHEGSQVTSLMLHLLI